MLTPPPALAPEQLELPLPSELPLLLGDIDAESLKRAQQWMEPLMSKHLVGKEFLKVKEVAKVLNVAPETVRLQVEAELLACVRVSNKRGEDRSIGTLRILRSSLLVQLWQHLTGKRSMHEAITFVAEVCATLPTAALTVLRDHLDQLIKSRRAAAASIG